MAKANGWLWNPAADLLIGCAGWTLPLLVLTYGLARGAGLDLVFAFALLSLVCNHPHYAATWVRAFGDRPTRAAYRVYTLHLTGLLVLALLAAHAASALVPLLFTLYVVWSPWHYSSQNFGLFVLFARRRGVQPAAEERQLLRTAFVASYLLWLLMVNTQPSTDPYIWSLDLPSLLTAPLGVGLVACFALAGGTALARMARRAGWRALAPGALLLSSQALWFVAPWAVQLAVGRMLSPLYYATGVLAFMHCAQYLWITSFYARAEAGGRWRAWPYAALLGLGGIGLFFAGPWMASALLGFDLRESLLIFIALINLHHFVLDGALWRLRDRRVAALLIDAAPAGAPPPAPRPLRPALGWALAAALLALAGLQLTQQYLTRAGADAAQLALAARLNPYDGRVAVRRAEWLASHADPDQALAALAGLREIRPGNATALRLYGTLLVETERYSEATAHYRAVDAAVGLDASGLVNAAVLAARDDRLDDAAAALRRALHLDPHLSAAHLNLASVCLQQGDGPCAMRHYEAYLTAPDVARDRAYAAASLNAASAAVLVERPAIALELLDAGAAVAAGADAPDLVELAARQAQALRNR